MHVSSVMEHKVVQFVMGCCFPPHSPRQGRAGLGHPEEVLGHPEEEAVEAGRNGTVPIVLAAAVVAPLLC